MSQTESWRLPKVGDYKVKPESVSSIHRAAALSMHFAVFSESLATNQSDMIVWSTIRQSVSVKRMKLYLLEGTESLSLYILFVKDWALNVGRTNWALR